MESTFKSVAWTQNTHYLCTCSSNYIQLLDQWAPFLRKAKQQHGSWQTTNQWSFSNTPASSALSGGRTASPSSPRAEKTLSEKTSCDNKIDENSSLELTQSADLPHTRAAQHTLNHFLSHARNTATTIEMGEGSDLVLRWNRSQMHWYQPMMEEVSTPQC